MSKQYNICEQCDLATDGCEKENQKCFYAADYEEILVCPYCGHKIDDWYELSQLGLIEDGQTDTTFNCGKCGNAMNVNSTPKYTITASPADEAAILRLGHSDFRTE